MLMTMMPPLAPHIIHERDGDDPDTPSAQHTFHHHSFIHLFVGCVFEADVVVCCGLDGVCVCVVVWCVCVCVCVMLALALSSSS